MALEAQWRITPPLVFSAHAIAVYLGALNVPKSSNNAAPESTSAADEMQDADDPDFMKFMQNLSSLQS